jgi:methionyl aminopeptidase
MPHDIAKFREAGAIAAKVRDHGKTLIVEGARLEAVALECERMIRELGGEPAFPCQLSRNHIAAHYCSPPGDPTTVQRDDIVKLDLGVHVDGYVCDCAVTVDVAEGPDSALVAASRTALENAIAHMGPGAEIATIGQVIHDTITAFGFKPVMNLTGHGVARFTVHCAPSIPNYGEKKSGRLRAGQTIACEPFASDGKGYVQHKGRAEVFMLRRNAKMKARLPKDVEDFLVATLGLPFARRDLQKHFDVKKTEEVLGSLSRQGLIQEYPPLTENPGVRISQHEHTIAILDRGAHAVAVREPGAWRLDQRASPSAIRALRPPSKALGSRCLTQGQTTYPYSGHLENDHATGSERISELREILEKQRELQLRSPFRTATEEND